MLTLQTLENISDHAAAANATRLRLDRKFYASQLDDNIAVAFRPAGETPGAAMGDLDRRLAERELLAQVVPELCGPIPSHSRSPRSKSC